MQQAFCSLFLPETLLFSYLYAKPASFARLLEKLYDRYYTYNRQERLQVILNINIVSRKIDFRSKITEESIFLSQNIKHAYSLPVLKKSGFTFGYSVIAKILNT